jgi:ankyrin repeat protein
MGEFRDKLNGYWGTDKFPNRVLDAIEMGVDVNETEILYLITSYIKDDKILLDILKKMELKGLNTKPSIVLDLIKFGQVESLKYFAAKGYDINLLDEYGQNGLFHLVGNDLPIEKFISSFSEFIILGVDHSILTKQKRNLIHRTVDCGTSNNIDNYLDIICSLDLNINNQDINGWTPLHSASNNSPSYIPILLKYGADKYLKTLGDSSVDEYDEILGGGLTPLDLYDKFAPIGAHYRDEKIVNLLK